jgi:hypothetical protein
MDINNSTGWQTKFNASLSTLADGTGLSLKSVQNARNLLKQYGRISFYSRGGRQSAVYTMIPIAGKRYSQEVQQDYPQEVQQDYPQEVQQDYPQDNLQEVHIPRLEERRGDLKEKEREKEKIPPAPKGGDALKSQKPKSPRFVPPTAEQVHDHCLEKGYDIDAEAFVAFYDSKGWMIGKNKMKDWKRAIVTWVKRQDKRIQRPAYQSRDDKIRAADEERRRRLAEYDRIHDRQNTTDIAGFLPK